MAQRAKRAEPKEIRATAIYKADVCRELYNAAEFHLFVAGSWPARQPCKSVYRCALVFIQTILNSRAGTSAVSTNWVSDLFLLSGDPLKALRKARSRCLDQLPVFELALKKRGRTSWRWCVCTTEGAVVMQGSESSGPAVKYKAAKALFLLLLSAPYRSIQLSTLRSPEYGRGLNR